VVAFFYVLALLAVGLSVFQFRTRSADRPLGTREASRNDVALYALLCVALCATFALQTALTDRAVLSQTPLPDWFRQLPLLYFAPYAPISATVDMGLIQWTQVLAVLESAILFGIYLCLRSLEHRRTALIATTFVAAAVLVAIALRSVTTDVDSYLYIGHGLVWPHEYAAPAAPFTADDALINRMWGTPLLPSAYGPLWNFLAHLALAGTSDLAQQALTVRLLGLGAIAVCIACVWRLSGPSIVAFVFTLDPAMYVRYLIRAHNDLSGVALILVAAVARKTTWVAVILVAAAGAIKFPLLLSGLVIFWDRPTLIRRLVPAAAAALLGIAVSYVSGGSEYVVALQAVYGLYDHAPPLAERAIHLLLVAVAFAAVALALFRQRFLFGAGWSFVALGQFPLAHYLGWCLPYVLLGEASALPFLVSWPALDQALTLEYPYTPFFLIERSLAIVFIVAAIGYGLIARRSKPAA
jgi:hypothetical protein